MKIQKERKKNKKSWEIVALIGIELWIPNAGVGGWGRSPAAIPGSYSGEPEAVA